MQPNLPGQPQQRPHRSPSQAAKYFQCGEAYRRIYIEGERQPPVLNMAKGTGMHGGAEHNFRQKIESRVDLPAEEIIDAAVAAFDKAIADGVTLDADELSLGKEVAIGVARDQVRQMAAAFSAYQAPEYQPLEVEKTVRIPVPRSTHDILGRLDLVAVDPGIPGIRAAVADGYVVRDFKTSKRKKSATNAAESFQLTTYAAGGTVAYSKPPVDVGLDVLVTTKTKGTSRQLLTAERDSGDYSAMASRLNAMEAGIKAGIFLPAAEGDWSCSAKYCPFHASCPYVNAARIAAAQEE